MKAVCKKLFSLMLVAILLVSAVPFQALAADATDATDADEFIEGTVVDANEPSALKAAEIPEKQKVQVHFQLGRIVDTKDGTVDFVEGSQNYAVSIVKSTIGSKASAPSSSSALTALGKHIYGTSVGYEFVRWYYGEAGTSYSSGSYLTTDMISDTDTDDDGNEIQIIDVYAEFREAKKTISLNANGGKVSASTHEIMQGKTYNYYGDLPTPTKTNSKFLGWYKSDNTLVTNTTTVTDQSKLTAKWSTELFTVTFQTFPADGASIEDWADVEGFIFTANEEYEDPSAIRAGSILTVADGHFPSTSQINSLFLGENGPGAGWEIDGWETSTGVAFTEGKTKLSDSMVDADGKIHIRPIYKKSITLYANNDGQSSRKLTVTLGKAIPSLPTPGAYEGHAFYSWCTQEEDVEILRADLSNVSKHPKYFPAMGNMFAQWKEAVTVLLNIYTNGNLKSPTLSKYYEAPNEIDFNLSEIDMYSVFPSYGNYDDSGDEQYGWYTQSQWYNYVIGKPATEYEIVAAENVGKEGYEEFYIMLINSGASENASSGNNYPSNNNADKTNPATGDQILMAVTVLAVSACALALIIYFKKRQAK